MPAPRSSLPKSLVAAIIAALVLGVAGVVMGVREAFATRLSRVVVGGGTAIVLIAYGLGLMGAAWGLSRRSRFARGPAVALGLILLPVAWSFLRPGTSGAVPPLLLAVGAALGVLALVLVVSLLLPASTRALMPDTSESVTDHSDEPGQR